MEKKTPLYDCHIENGAKIVPFAGHLLPVSYKAGIIAEHMAVRERAGMFDVSHMGMLRFSGADALTNIQYLFTNDFANMVPGRVRYSLMCYENGGTVDDLIVYKYAQDDFLVVVNASNREKDEAFMRARLIGKVTLTDITEGNAQIALQGPQSKNILKKLCNESLLPEKYYTFASGISVDGILCTISQTGYTGEFGYEIHAPRVAAPRLWRMLMSAGQEFGLIPCGLGARDTLRLEASMPLYGHELTPDITPLEAGLSFGVKLDKEDFVGRDAMRKNPPSRMRAGLKLSGRGIAREGQEVYLRGEKIGVVTSGTHCPYLSAAYAMALVTASACAVGDEVDIDVRGKRIPAQIVPLPFYKRAK